MNEQIHYAANGSDDFDPEVAVSQEKVITGVDFGKEPIGEIGYAAAMEETECKLCEGTGENNWGQKCKECSTDYDKLGND